MAEAWWAKGAHLELETRPWRPRWPPLHQGRPHRAGEIGPRARGMMPPDPDLDMTWGILRKDRAVRTERWSRRREAAEGVGSICTTPPPLACACGDRSAAAAG